MESSRSGVMPMRKVLLMSLGGVRPRAGEIGPVRREIIFEPLHEQPAPAEPAPSTPEREPETPAEPAPSR
jgi:hypothetical protein